MRGGCALMSSSLPRPQAPSPRAAATRFPLSDPPTQFLSFGGGPPTRPAGGAEGGGNRPPDKGPGRGPNITSVLYPGPPLVLGPLRPGGPASIHGGAPPPPPAPDGGGAGGRTSPFFKIPKPQKPPFHLGCRLVAFSWGGEQRTRRRLGQPALGAACAAGEPRLQSCSPRPVGTRSGVIRGHP